ncbi:MAG: Mu transposase C-terminal domain-containing protein [Treponema sp.]|nr:Mu transposase C-terminal domain-containing protein [Treponema sp.]
MRAKKEGWPYRSYAVRGGQERRYHLANLPEDIQTAYAESLAIGLEELQSALKPVLVCEKKVVLANYNGRSGGGGGEPPPLERADKKKRRTANLRAKVIRAWDDTGWNVEQFIFEYNAGNIASDLRAELGGKQLSKSTLYNWLGKYQNHDEAGLVPQYKKRGGCGASLDKHTKELIWFYYLHKNKPSAARVIRLLAEKEKIEVNPCIVYRYIRYEIPQNVKDYFRKGEKYYHDHYESYVSIDYTRYHAMEMVVYDHKTLDFASRVKRADGWRRVRLVLTCILDKRSRMILGWWIDEVPSTVTIIRATRMMVEACGCPESGQFDNGRDFKSCWFSGDAWNEQRDRFGKKEREAVSCVTGDLGMAVHFTEPYHGQSKHIERAFGFFAAEFDKSFESYLGSNTSDRHDESRLYTGAFDGAPARPIGELPTLEETRALFAAFAEWHNTKHKHRGQGMGGKTPRQVFNETLRGRRDLPEGWEKYVWTRREIKTVQRNGLLSEEQWYYNPAMQAITGQRVELRVSIDDIGKAYIFNLEGEYLYDAVSQFKDSGITEENVRNVRRRRKEARKDFDKYKNAIKEIGKDRKTLLEEMRDGQIPDEPEDTREVAGGEPLAVIKRRLRLPTDPD